MDFTSFLKSFKDELAIEADLSAETAFKEASWWDSMSVLDVIALADRDFNTALDLGDFKHIRTLNELFEFISAKSQQKMG